MRVPRPVHDQKGALLRIQTQQGHIKRAAPEVKHDNFPVALVVIQAVRDGGRNGLLNHAYKREARLVCRPDRRCFLVVAEADGHRHRHALELEAKDSAQHAAGVLGHRLHAPQQKGAHLLWRDHPALHDRHRVALLILADNVLQRGALQLNHRVVIVQPNEPLCAVDHVARMLSLERMRMQADSHCLVRDNWSLPPVRHGRRVEVHH
mmetsp:Transcript_27374/g.71054  ORF Transcript_27374/g.71054 Transcript_27374/m.71054 type:complete len:207 (+) Transcript_27374:535-1155(+)